MVRKLLSMQPELYAAPMLLERYSEPKHPKDLETFPCINFSHNAGSWALTKGKQNITVRPNSVHTVNTSALSLDFALAGLGAAWLIAPLASRFTQDGQIVKILHGWAPPGGVDLSLVMAGRRLPRRVRLLVDHLVEHFGELSAGMKSGT